MPVKNQSFNEKFKNMSIKKKLTLSHGIIILMTFILITVLLVSMKAIETKVDGLFEGPTTNTFYIGDIRLGVTDIQRAINYTIACGEENVPENVMQLEADITKNTDLVKQAFAVLGENLTSDEELALLGEMTAVSQGSMSYREEVVNLIKKGELSAAMEMNTTGYKPAVDKLKSLADELDQHIYATGEKYTKSADLVANIMVLIGGIMLAIVTYIAVCASKKVRTSLDKPIAQVTEAAMMMQCH